MPHHVPGNIICYSHVFIHYQMLWQPLVKITNKLLKSKVSYGDHKKT